LEESPGTSLEERLPCPNCGSLSRNFVVNIQEPLTVSEVRAGQQVLAEYQRAGQKRRRREFIASFAVIIAIIQVTALIAIATNLLSGDLDNVGSSLFWWGFIAGLLSTFVGALAAYVLRRARTQQVAANEELQQARLGTAAMQHRLASRLRDISDRSTEAESTDAGSRARSATRDSNSKET
jgi:hypothetical protein